MTWCHSHLKKLYTLPQMKFRNIKNCVQDSNIRLQLQQTLLSHLRFQPYHCRCSVHNTNNYTSQITSLDNIVSTVSVSRSLAKKSYYRHRPKTSLLSIATISRLDKWNTSKQRKTTHLHSNPTQSYLFNVLSKRTNSFRASSISITTKSKGSKLGIVSSILKDVSALMIKRLPKKKTPRFNEDGKRVEVNSVVAYAVAEELSLGQLCRHLNGHNTYTQGQLPNDVTDAIYVRATDFDQGKKDIFIFEDGSVVFWCVPEIERKSFIRMLRNFAEGPFKKDLYYDKEEMDVEFTTQNSRLLGDVIQLQTTPDPLVTPTTLDPQCLQMYSFSNALAQSVKLAMWETSLGLFVESIEGVTEDLKHGQKIKMSRREVLMKTGELFSLRHLINLSSDLLDTPDFYWDRSDLEPLYTNLCVHLNIRRRTRVINEKLTHCVELTDLLTSQLNDAHHTRLEWMIIVLIMVEVVFEIVHYTERYHQVDKVSSDS